MWQSHAGGDRIGAVPFTGLIVTEEDVAELDRVR
jgi:hypothetical protein